MSAVASRTSSVSARAPGPVPFPPHCFLHPAQVFLRSATSLPRTKSCVSTLTSMTDTIASRTHTHPSHSQTSRLLFTCPLQGGHHIPFGRLIGWLSYQPAEIFFYPAETQKWFACDQRKIPLHLFYHWFQKPGDSGINGKKGKWTLPIP